ncbi:hypothetical protein SLEP1_g58786 [Rubroshorea leprosula]|uniref:NB-ARC domain-containing protein n=1 Tax=Rubroshorea leprosula TaxID=152421 RepID=A0AAV5MV08_9ROSI|nr:hypothetical protein SLEP1_g58786 [Rubroshorea leprosula]
MQVLIDLWKQITLRTNSSQESHKNLKEVELIQKISNFLKDKECLIIFDEITEGILDSDTLQKILPELSKGSRVIFTAREDDEFPIKLTEEQKKNFVKISELNGGDCYDSFKEKVLVHKIEEKDLVHKIEEPSPEDRRAIVEKTGGIPLAVVLFAGVVSYTPSARWSDVIKLEYDYEWQFNYMGHLTLSINKKLRNILIMSYDLLPNPLKPLFLYLCLFPKSFEIPFRRLMLLWMAEGLLPAGEIEPEEQARAYFMELVYRNMIEVAKWSLDGSPKTCQIPSILYDVFSQKSLHLGFFYAHKHSNGEGDYRQLLKVRRLAEYQDVKNYPSTDLNTPHVRSYVCFDIRHHDVPNQETGKYLNKMVVRRGFGLLRVLDLEGVFKPLLPETIGKMLHLKYFGLRWTFLDSLPLSLGNLPNLEALDFKHTYIHTLPPSIWKAEKLRHLYMNNIYLDKPIPELSVQSLIQFKTLSGLILGDESPLKDGLNQLKGLWKLSLTYYSIINVETEMFKWISHLSHLESLKLRSIDESGEPSKLNLDKVRMPVSLTKLYLFGSLQATDIKFPRRIKVLTLSLSGLKEDPMPILGQLEELKVLKLFANSYLGSLMTCNPGSFPKLRVLKLWMLKELEEWSVAEGAMPCLEELEIRCCDKLKNVPQLNRVASLKELILTNMPASFASEAKSKTTCTCAVSVNQWTFSSTEVLIDLWKQITLRTNLSQESHKNLKEVELIEKINNFLKDKECLIIFDEITEGILDSDTLQKILPELSKGSRVIFTAREDDEFPIKLTEEQKKNFVKISELNGGDCYDSFKEKVLVHKIEEKDLVHKIEEPSPEDRRAIVEKTGGIPLAVVLFAGVVSYTPSARWSDVIKLEYDYEWQFNYMGHMTLSINKKLRNILIMSYDLLPNPLKPLFLYLCLFPKSFEIPFRRLMLLWMAEGLLPAGKVEPEEQARAYFMELVYRNMIEVAKWSLDGSPKTCQMPSILYDVFSQKSLHLGIFYAHKHSNGEGDYRQLLKVRRLAEYQDVKNYPSTDLNTPHVRSYVCFDIRHHDVPNQETGKYLNKMVVRRGFGLLRVLDLEGVFKPLLPETIGKMLHLKYFGLRWTFLDSLPLSLGNLPNLEALDFKHTYIHTLPPSIWKAEKLRHLYMNNIYLDKPIPELSVQSLIQFKTLSGLILGDESPLKDGLNQLKGLWKLSLTYYSIINVETEMFRWISSLSHLESLKLRSIDESGEPSKLNLDKVRMPVSLTKLYLFGSLQATDIKFPRRIKVLTLSLSGLKEDPMPILGQLEELKVLKLFAKSYLGSQMTCGPESFPKLRVLKFWMLKDLKTWSVAENAMPCLEELEIRCCDNLENIVDQLKRVKSLKELILTNMPTPFVLEAKNSIKCTCAVLVNQWTFPFTEEQQQPSPSPTTQLSSS